MIAILRPDCSLRDKAQVVALIEERGLRVHLDSTDGREWVGVLGHNAKAIAEELTRLPGVEEVRSVRATIGQSMLLVTPGIRPQGSDAGDQKRIVTPSEAIRAGSDYLVVGRPVSEAASPAEAARAIVSEIESAL